jgi:ATP-grasp domain/L-amino acid ligase C-terminal domain 2/ATP-grasp N-terminal domain
MPRVLLLATTTGYQTRMFGDAAEQLGVDLVFATDRCHMIDDPWRDAAIAIRFHDEEASVEAIVRSAAERPIDGVLAVGDRPAVIAARAARAIGLPWHLPAGAAVAHNKLLTRERLRAAGLPVPQFAAFSLSASAGLAAAGISFPCVVKPVALSASRGVMRADDPAQLTAAVERLRVLMRSPDVRAERNDAHDVALVESFIAGREYAVEALMHHGTLHPLAIFDKPDPLDGPFFEETIYVTPPAIAAEVEHAIVDAVGSAARAIGLSHGPVHAECRVHRSTTSGRAEVFVLEVAARPIGGLCARTLRFFAASAAKGRPDPCSLEELLLRQALGESPADYSRERCASGVMMIPIPRRGAYRGVSGVDAASAVDHVDDIRITAKPDQLLVPLPEGASYLGFIFARADDSRAVERALRDAHARLRFAIDAELPVRLSAGSTTI